MRKIMITGASGFAGKHLTERLSSSLHLEVLSVPHTELELLDSAAVERYLKTYSDIDVVIHCAAVGGARKTNYDVSDVDVVEKNLRMFLNINRCLLPHQRMIHLGSGAEYAREHYQPKMGEGFFDSFVPSDSYGYAKYAISKLIEQMPNVLCLRIFGLYGKYEDYRCKFISNAIVKNLLGLPITIAQNVMFDYLYAPDFAALIEKLVNCDWPYRHMNITPTESVDLVTIADIINGKSEKKSEIRVLNPGLNTAYSGSNERLLRMVGPYQFTPFSFAITEMVDYYRLEFESLDLETVRNDPYLSHCRVNSPTVES